MSSDLTTLMRTSTAEITPSPELVRLSLRSGKRRLLRRRLQATGVAVVLLAAVPLGVDAAHLAQPPAAVAFAGPLDDGRTHGDLANDSAYLQSALATWNDWRPTDDRHRFQDPRGEAVVAWAGSTPAGPAAVIAQAMRSKDGVERVAAAYVGTDGQQPRIVGVTLAESGGRRDAAWYVDPARHVLAVVDEGTARGVSTAWTYQADGEARHRYTQLIFDDGVAVARVPDGAYNVTQVADLVGGEAKDRVGIAGLIVDDNKVRGLRWNSHGPYDTLLPTAGATTAIGAPDKLATDEAVTHEIAVALERNTDQSFGMLMPIWAVYGVTQDGRRFSVFERALDNDPARLYLLLGGRLSDHGPVRVRDPLPVAINLGAGQGWVVARYGAALRSRTAGGSWHDVGHDAALVPSATSEIQVTMPGTSPVTVPLPN